MNHMTPKQQAENEHRLDPAQLEKVTTVYGEIAYIPRDRKAGRLIPLYQKNGLRLVERRQKDNIRWWTGQYLHPDNILTPNTPPMSGDYLQLLSADGKPSENHAEIFNWVGTNGTGVYLVEDMQGEVFVCVRNEELDTQKRRAWQQVNTGV